MRCWTIRFVKGAGQTGMARSVEGDQWTTESEDIPVIEKTAYTILQRKLIIAIGALEAGAEFYKADDVNGFAGEICKEALEKILDVK